MASSCRSSEALSRTDQPHQGPAKKDRNQSLRQMSPMKERWRLSGSQPRICDCQVYAGLYYLPCTPRLHPFIWTSVCYLMSVYFLPRQIAEQASGKVLKEIALIPNLFSPWYFPPPSYSIFPPHRA